MQQGFTCKTYVKVNVDFTEEGQIIPRNITWEDGHVYEITRITDTRRSCSLKAGGSGIRYTCIISGRTSFLFMEDNNRWFVERKQSAY